MTVSIEQQGPVSTIVLSRPEVRNAVDRPTAEALGLVNRVVEPGGARQGAEALALSIAAFPQECMRSDRRSAYEQGGLGEAEAMAQELHVGLPSLHLEGIQGARHFSGGGE